MEDNGLYPPKMVLETTEIPSIPVTVTVTFRGILESKEETMMQITLPYNGIMHIPVHMYKYYISVAVQANQILENLSYVT